MKYWTDVLGHAASFNRLKNVTEKRPEHFKPSLSVRQQIENDQNNQRQHIWCYVLFLSKFEIQQDGQCLIVAQNLPTLVINTEFEQEQKIGDYSWAVKIKSVFEFQGIKNQS